MFFSLYDLYRLLISCEQIHSYLVIVMLNMIKPILICSWDVHLNNLNKKSFKWKRYSYTSRSLEYQLLSALLFAEYLNRKLQSLDLSKDKFCCWISSYFWFQKFPLSSMIFFKEEGSHFPRNVLCRYFLFLLLIINASISGQPPPPPPHYFLLKH